MSFHLLVDLHQEVYVCFYFCWFVYAQNIAPTKQWIPLELAEFKKWSNFRSIVYSSMDAIMIYMLQSEDLERHEDRRKCKVRYSKLRS